MPQTQPRSELKIDSLNQTGGDVLQLGEWCFEPELNRISRDGKSTKLEPQLARLLHFLARGSRHVLTKDQILDGVWGTRFVADSALTRAIAELRRALGDDAHHPRFIETIPKRGYRLLVPVEAGARVGKERKGLTTLGLGRSRRRAPLMLLGLFALLVTVGYATSQRAPSPTAVIAAPTDLRLAVLPLSNLTADPAQDFFASGMTEALITNLAQISSLSVISRRSVEPFRDDPRPLADIAEALGVDLAVEGSVLQAGGRIRVSVQLTDLEDGTHLWAESYERQSSDVLRLQSEIALAIAQEIRATLAPASALGEGRVDPEVYELYLKGRQALMDCDKEGPNQAAHYFQAALDLDPAYAPAHAGLAEYYARLAMYGHATPDRVLPLARAAARQAIYLDSSLAEAYAASAFVRFTFDLDWAGAERDFRQALALSPGDAWLHQRYSLFLTCLGRFEEALTFARRSVELDPLSAGTRNGLAWVYLNARRYEESLVEMERVIELGLATEIHPYAAWAYALMARQTEALAEIESKGRAESPAFLGIESWILSRVGRLEEAREIRRELEYSALKPEVDPYGLALAHAGLGEIDQAIAALEQAYATRSPNLIYLKVEPFFDNLQSDPRYQRLREKVGLGLARAVLEISGREPGGAQSPEGGIG